jgi:hypothetical protein
MEESFGTFKSAKAVYDRILDLKIATPQVAADFPPNFFIVNFVTVFIGIWLDI